MPDDISSDGTHLFDYGYLLVRTPEENGVPNDSWLERADVLFVFETVFLINDSIILQLMMSS